ncbi:type II secretion system protein [bacterium]|nr:type II secretion system protein [bacterium]
MTNKLNQFTTHYSLLTNFAFTLAETLIVMGIIGVVAALTLPNLNSSTGDKEKVTKLKKIYSNLNDAFGRAEAIYGPLETWCPNYNSSRNASERVGERITEFMKLSKNCELATNTGCWSKKKLNKMDNTQDVDNISASTPAYKSILADGTSIAFFCSDDATECIIDVDIDGPNKGPFAYNRDIFEFGVGEGSIGIWPYYTYYNGSIPAGNLSKDDCNVSMSCTDWVIYNENMDYLKLDSNSKCNGVQLNWQTQTSCK